MLVFSFNSCLSYRFHKQGIDVDLSPHSPLSCFLRDCNGNKGIDPLLNLVKNGTVTEECLPYSSNKKIIEECRKLCKDGSVFQKFYAKNAYKIPKINENNYYDIVEYIIEQIYNYGPVYSSMISYKDFNSLEKRECNKKDYIYSSDG